ncbi:E3 ubiquitin-protein ligase UPL3 [Linum grandiflorum]
MMGCLMTKMTSMKILLKHSVGSTQPLSDCHVHSFAFSSSKAPKEGCFLEPHSGDVTLPGYPDYILKTGDQTVDIHNLEEYISLVVDATVKTRIMRQMDAFRAGFNQVFDLASLQIFSPLELDNLLCGRRELWEVILLI